MRGTAGLELPRLDVSHVTNSQLEQEDEDDTERKGHRLERGTHLSGQSDHGGQRGTHLSGQSDHGGQFALEMATGRRHHTHQHHREGLDHKHPLRTPQLGGGKP